MFGVNVNPDLRTIRDHTLRKIREEAIGPLFRKLLCMTGKHHYHLVDSVGPMGEHQMVVCRHCGLGHKVNRSYR